MSQKEKAYQIIRDAISYGKLKPGERLIESKTCEMFKLGRTPLREAFHLLHNEGYIDLSIYRGAVVRKFSIQEVEEMYEVIAILESYAAEKATRLMNTAILRELKALQRDLVILSRKRDYRNWLENNTAFHEYITNASGNQNLSILVQTMRKKVFRYRIINIMTPENFKHYMKDHEEILKAVLDGKPTQAGYAMRKHGFHVREMLANFLQQNPEY